MLLRQIKISASKETDDEGPCVVTTWGEASDLLGGLSHWTGRAYFVVRVSGSGTYSGTVSLRPLHWEGYDLQQHVERGLNSLEDSAVRYSCNEIIATHY